jgi:hypothetical protein
LTGSLRPCPLSARSIGKRSPSAQRASDRAMKRRSLKRASLLDVKHFLYHEEHEDQERERSEDRGARSPAVFVAFVLFVLKNPIDQG